MAGIDPLRRAEIGREKRARTRSTLIGVALTLFARQSVDSVTVDDVVKEAGVARGIFYTHFDDLSKLVEAVEFDLVDAVDKLLQPTRVVIDEPMTRIAFGCASFLDEAIADPTWARIVAKMGARMQLGGQTVVKRLQEDLRKLASTSPGVSTPEIGVEIVVGMTLWFVGAFGEGRLAAHERDTATVAILRALGVGNRRIGAALKALPRSRHTA